MDRGDHVQRDLAAHVLAHLFMHQTHHRGQVHAMLAGTAVAPPQLDEFLMPSEAHLRVQDMQALGWDETAVASSQAALATDFAPLTDMRASAAYRLQVAQNLLKRLWLETRLRDPLHAVDTNVWSTLAHVVPEPSGAGAA